MTDTAIFRVPLMRVQVPDDRARDLDEVWAQALADIIKSQGLLQPIRVRKVGNGHQLVLGRHRLRAFEINGEDDIPCLLSTAETDDEARLEEVMENLGRNELNALDRCHHLFEMKAVYERMYPEAKNGGDRKSEEIRTKTFRSDIEGKEKQVFGFADFTAEQVGLSARAIQIAVKIWSDLDPAVRSRLAGTKTATKQSEIKLLSAQKPAAQGKLLDLILDDTLSVDGVQAAMDYMASGVTLSDTEKQFTKFNAQWKAIPDTTFESLVTAHKDRIIAALKRTGDI